MEEIKGKVENGTLMLYFCGNIDSGNAPQVEQEALKIIDENGGLPIKIDASELNYISSAGLRVILRLRKSHPELSIIGVKSEIYEILDMTGFTQMMPVEKAYRVVSIEGCEEIGRGANGTIYRIDMDNVVKVYNNADALEDIQHEREVARKALILGIPTAISYDVVRVGESYGSVFELLNAQSFTKIIATQPEKLDWCVNEYVDLLKKIHSTVVPKGELPDVREKYISYAAFLKDHLPEWAGEKLAKLIEAVPQNDHMIHGDYHTKNVELVGDEVLLIDMDTLAVGDPIFELGSIFNAYIGFSELDHENIMRFQGFSFETGTAFWQKSLRAYLGTDDAAVLKDAEDKARIIGYTRLIRHFIRKGDMNDEQTVKELEFRKKNLLELLEKTDSLVIGG